MNETLSAVLTVETLLTQQPLYLLSLSALLGLIVGSFLNVVIHRLPIMLERAWQRECAELYGQADVADAAPFNLAVPASRCPHCGHRLRVWENIPLLSYLLLRGRCSQCQAPISWRYPAVELSCALLSALTVWHFGWSGQTLGALLLVWGLLALTLIDLEHQLLPDMLTLPLLWLGLALNSAELFVPLEHALWGAIAGYLALWSIFWLFKLLTGKDGMGYGDFKLLAALGAWLGWQTLPLVILLASLLGSLGGIAAILLSGHDRRQALPFGPSLALAGMIGLYWGQDILSWYLMLAF